MSNFYVQYLLSYNIQLTMKLEFELKTVLTSLTWKTGDYFKTAKSR